MSLRKKMAKMESKEKIQRGTNISSKNEQDLIENF
jgi:hypothetical protein